MFSLVADTLFILNINFISDISDFDPQISFREIDSRDSNIIFYIYVFTIVSVKTKTNKQTNKQQ